MSPTSFNLHSSKVLLGKRSLTIYLVTASLEFWAVTALFYDQQGDGQ